MKKNLMLLGACLSPSLALGQDFISAEVFTDAESFSYSDAFPIRSYLNFLEGPAPERGNHVLTRNKIELGMRVENFTFSVLHRNDYNLDFTSDAATFAYTQKVPNNDAGIEVELGREYAVEITANQYQLSGLKFGYDWALQDSMKVSAAFAYYMATEGISGYLGKDPEGNGGFFGLQETTEGGVTLQEPIGDLYADYYYTRDVLFRRDVVAANGYGYSLDLAFEWTISPQWWVRAQIDDLTSAIRWKDMPRTIADATDETVVVNEDGLLEAYPRFAGVETFGDFTQKLRQRDRLWVRYHLPRYYFGYEYERMEVVNFHRAVAGYYLNESWAASVALEVDSLAWHWRLHGPLGSFQLVFDELDLDNARTLGFSWAWRFPL